MSTQPWPKLTKVELQFQELKARLEEAEQTLDAIREGEVDALVVNGTRGQQVYTLRGADQAYRVFVEQMQEGAATLSEDGTVLYSNARLAEMLGLPLERLTGLAVSEIIDSSSIADFQELLVRAKEGPVKGEALLASPSRTPALVSVTSLPDEEAYYSLVITDLTDQKLGAEISAAERLARSILDNAAEAIVVCDRQGVIIRANAQTERLANRAVINEHLVSAFPFIAEPENEPGICSAVSDALSGKVVRGLEASFERDGNTVDLLISAGPLSGAEGSEPAGCVVTMIEITERNAAFRAVRELNESLEERVASRTAQLEGANRELEGFCYSVSHDLRAPLRGIMGSAMILIEDHSEKLTGDARDQLARLGVAAKTMGALIDDLLQFSRLTRRAMRRQEIDLSKVASDVSQDLLHDQNFNHTKIVIEPGLRAEGDPELIKMAVENLIGNAIKFSHKNPEAEVFVGRAEGHSDAFVVRDNGVGFDQNYVGKIFLPFERLHTANEFPGTGIGLANVQRIISRHGGRVWAEAELNKGASFYFELP